LAMWGQTCPGIRGQKAGGGGGGVGGPVQGENGGKKGFRGPGRGAKRNFFPKGLFPREKAGAAPWVVLEPLGKEKERGAGEN